MDKILSSKGNNMKKVGPGLLRAYRFVALSAIVSLCALTSFTSNSFAATTSTTASSSTGTTLLPPVDGNGALCSNVPGLLQWGGATTKQPITCDYQLFGTPAARNGTSTTGNIFQNNPTYLRGGLTVSGPGAIVGGSSSHIAWHLSDPQCAQGGNLVLDQSGNLRCCPYGKVVTSFNEIGAPMCGTLN